MANPARLISISLALLLAAAATMYAADAATMENNASPAATKAASDAAADTEKYVGLLEYTAIQNALGLDAKQRKQITGVNNSLDESVPDPESLRNLPANQREIQLHTWEAKAQQLKAKLGKILSPEQVKRLKEIALQLRLEMRSSSLLAEKDFADKLSITDSQKQELQSLRQRIRDKISKARESLVQAGQETKETTEDKTEQFRKKFRELRDQAYQQAMGILTPEQKKKLSELTGKAADINIDDILAEQSARVEKWAGRWKKQRNANGKEAQAEDATQTEHHVGTTSDEAEEGQTQKSLNESKNHSEKAHTGSDSKND